MSRKKQSRKRLLVPEGKSNLTAAEYLNLSGGTPARSSKYNNKITERDGFKFHSKKEADYYSELLLKKKAGAIKDFTMQGRFSLIPALKGKERNYREKYYLADFIVTNNDGSVDVIDTKGKRTKEYQIKKHLMYQIHKIEIIEV